MPTRQLLVDGHWVDAASGKTFDDVNPSTGEVLARVAEGDETDIDRAVAAARTAFDDGPWPRMSGDAWARILLRIAEILEREAERIARLESEDNGRPLRETLAQSAIITGSTATGQAVARLASRTLTLKRVACELGGNAANIVFADADLEAAVHGARFAGFIGQGQTCIPGGRLFLQAAIHDEFLARFADKVSRIRVGNPLQTDAQMGPLI